MVESTIGKGEEEKQGDTTSPLSSCAQKHKEKTGGGGGGHLKASGGDTDGRQTKNGGRAVTSRDSSEITSFVSPFAGPRREQKRQRAKPWDAEHTRSGSTNQSEGRRRGWGGQ